MPSQTLKCVETLVYKNSLDRRPTPKRKSMFSVEVDKEAVGYVEDTDEDPHEEGTSHLRKGSIALA